MNKADLFQGNKFHWKLEETTETKTSNTSMVTIIAVFNAYMRLLTTFCACSHTGSPHLIDEIKRFKEYISGGVSFHPRVR